MRRGALIFLYGPPLAGKSTLGRAYARWMDLPFWDVDNLIESRMGLSVEKIFSSQGESQFRQWEYQVLQELCTEERGVVALGGGALTQPVTRKLVEENGEVVLLEVSQQRLIERLKDDKVKRPLFGDSTVEGLVRLLEQRRAHYRSFSKKIFTDHQRQRELLHELEVLLGMFNVKGMGHDYHVWLRAGSLDDVGKEIRTRNLSGPVAVVTDENVGDLYAGRVLDSLEEADYRSSLIVFPPGEGSKTMATVQDVWRQFLNSDVERGSTVVSLGGGVVGDLTGFAAATYHRGVNWINVPTSLLAMVDAGIGGKTGVDLPQGKNLVGAFHPPRQVWADPEVLDTLPEKELHSGMAEVIKHGMISDPELFAMVAKGKGSFLKYRDEILRRAVAVKIKYIRKDPFDRDQRQTLNFGHTLGHAVEFASGYTMSHGEAIAIGMTAEANLAEQLGLAASGLTEELINVLQRWELPVKVPPNLEEEAIWEAVKRDKKKSGGRLQFALPVAVGQVKARIEVKDSNLKSAFNIVK